MEDDRMMLNMDEFFVNHPDTKYIQ
jgi:hypothetical protein